MPGASISRSATSVIWSLQARWSGVNPYLSTALMSAPAVLSASSTRAGSALRTAATSGVSDANGKAWTSSGSSTW